MISTAMLHARMEQASPCRAMTRVFIVLLCALPLFAQSKTGELRLRVTDPGRTRLEELGGAGERVQSIRRRFAPTKRAALDAQRLPFGMYRLEVKCEGFAPVSQSLEIRSAIPGNSTVKLSVAGMNTSVNVSDQDTLIDPDQVGAVNQIGSEAIADRVTSLPGRSLQDLVNSQPGWLYEGNAVLHPRGSEYQTQFVVNGIPLTDNRSPGSARRLKRTTCESMSVYTAGIPAEYGRKMGGVVEVNTARDSREVSTGKWCCPAAASTLPAPTPCCSICAGKNLFGISATAP